MFIIPWIEKDADWFKAAFKPVIVTVDVNGELAQADTQPAYARVKDKLPKALDHIIGYLANKAADYNNNLQWREQKRFKADFMNHQADWKQVDPEMAFLRCVELGMSAEDSKEISSMIKQLKEGYKFRSKCSYKEGFGR